MVELTDEQRDVVCEDYLDGKTRAWIANKFDCSITTVGRILAIREIEQPKKKRKPKAGNAIKQFSSRVKSTLWRQDHDHKTYNSWQERVDWLSSKAGGGYTKSQAVVRASKEFPCLERFFREYDVSEYDPNPESHAHIDHGNGAGDFSDMVCENAPQSYRENIRWAMDAAGAKIRLGAHPATCPNDQAFYLYRQAIEEPKDFLAKMNQLELKTDNEEKNRQNLRSNSKRSIEEIKSYLEELETEEEENYANYANE